MSETQEPTTDCFIVALGLVDFKSGIKPGVAIFDSLEAVFDTPPAQLDSMATTFESKQGVKQISKLRPGHIYKIKKTSNDKYLLGDIPWVDQLSQTTVSQIELRHAVYLRKREDAKYANKLDALQEDIDVLVRKVKKLSPFEQTAAKSIIIQKIIQGINA